MNANILGSITEKIDTDGTRTYEARVWYVSQMENGHVVKRYSGRGAQTRAAKFVASHAGVEIVDRAIMLQLEREQSAAAWSAASK